MVRLLLVAFVSSVLLFLSCESFVAPATMRAVRKTGLKGCRPPAFSCVSEVNDTKTPTPGPLEVLIEVAGSSINADDIPTLGLPAVHYTPGIDVAGVVVALGLGTSGRIKVGDKVWAGDIGLGGGMAQYATRPEALCGVLPEGIDLATAATLPNVAMASLGALLSAGAPWPRSSNTTVVITAGAGGTGYVAVQLARALGAHKIVTAASGAGIAFVKSLGADVVVDYKKRSVYDAVEKSSVDVVLSNHKSNDTAANAMAVLKAPGVYVTLNEDRAKHVPEGVKEVNYALLAPSEAVHWVSYLDQLGSLLKSGELRAVVNHTFNLEHVTDALNAFDRGPVLSKISVVP